MFNAFLFQLYQKGKGQVGEKKKEKKGRVKGVGSGVLSHHVTLAVPAALVSLTTGFGMGPGVPSRL
jgi:hypothetical protein